MGTDCAPLVADLFLFSYEFEFMKSLIRTDLSVAAKFSNTCRYICSAQSGNLRNLEIALRILRIPRLRTVVTRSRDCAIFYPDAHV